MYLFPCTFKLYKRYGPVFTVYLGPKKMVVVAGPKAIKQALVNNDAFEDKENPPIITDLGLSHGEEQCMCLNCFVSKEPFYICTLFSCFCCFALLDNHAALLTVFREEKLKPCHLQELFFQMEIHGRR